MSPEGFWQAVADLSGVPGSLGDFSLSPLAGGANNRLFRVNANGFSTVLKAYFQHTDDPRDRLGTEFAFSRFAWENGLRCLPQPLACDLRNRLGLYEFIEGRQLLPHEVTEGFVCQALNFYCELNRHRWLPHALALPQASEACFSIAEHLQCVERRLQKLRGMNDSSEINREATSFVRNELWEVWRGVSDSVRKQTFALGLTLEGEIAQQDKCLSPSDFGFHNAIVTCEGQLRFIDFEYAGWDDPVKMVCDFFCQPAVPLPLDYYDMFVKTVVSDLSEPEIYFQYATMLLPVHQVKWCCIMLNDFLPVGNARRRFACRAVAQEEQKAGQLEKARRALQSVAW